MRPRPPSSPLFPYTTLFRSPRDRGLGGALSLGHGGAPPAREASLHRQDARKLRPRRTHSSHVRSEEHTSELQSHSDLVCRLLLEKKKHQTICRFAYW